MHPPFDLCGQDIPQCQLLQDNLDVGPAEKVVFDGSGYLSGQPFDASGYESWGKGDLHPPDTLLLIGVKKHPDCDAVGDPPNEGPDKRVKQERQDLHEICVKQKGGPVGIEQTIRAQAILLGIVSLLRGINVKIAYQGCGVKHGSH
jgi:hypothetical protein